VTGRPMSSSARMRPTTRRRAEGRTA
jgi:hypothetical protein